MNTQKFSMVAVFVLLGYLPVLRGADNSTMTVQPKSQNVIGRTESIFLPLKDALQRSKSLADDEREMQIELLNNIEKEVRALKGKAPWNTESLDISQGKTLKSLLRKAIDSVGVFAVASVYWDSKTNDLVRVTAFEVLADYDKYKLSDLLLLSRLYLAEIPNKQQSEKYSRIWLTSTTSKARFSAHITSLLSKNQDNQNVFDMTSKWVDGCSWLSEILLKALSVETNVDRQSIIANCYVLTRAFNKPEDINTME